MQTGKRRLDQVFSLLCGWVTLLCAAAAGPAVFLTDEMECRLGESVMIPVRVESAVQEVARCELLPEKPGVIELLRQPEILKGQDTGFARIRTLAPGETVLKCGESRLRVKVTAERPVTLLRKMRPRFTSPSQGACVWGRIAIGVDVWVGAPGAEREVKPAALLRLPDGRELAADEAFPPIDGPFWRLVYFLDTASLPPGECEFTVSCKPPVKGGGKMEPLVSDPHLLTLLAAPGSGDSLFSGECEAGLATPRTERMGLEAPGVAMDSTASGYRAVSLRRARPVWVIRPEIAQPGRYQLMVRARGTLAGAAYPSLGMVLGENANDSGAVRLVTSSWHHLPVGRPVQLGKGPQWIGLGLANEFNYRNQLQRQAEIDCYELRRVPDVTGDSGGGMMMAEGMMTQGGGAPDKTIVARGLKLAFATIHDGQAINGRLSIRAALYSPALKNDAEYRGIRTELWIDDERLASAHGRNPVFTVHPHDLKKGSNRLQMHAVSPCGNRADSLVQTLLADSPAHPRKELETAYDSDRYDLNRAGWDKIAKEPMSAQHPLAVPNGPPAAHSFTKGAPPVRLALPDAITGKRRLSLHARAIPDAAPGLLSIKLHQPNARHRALREMEIGRITPQAAWNWQPLAAVELAEGRKFVTIELLDGAAALAGFSIDTAKFLDAAPPVLSILYPKPGAVISAEGDALVVKAFDDLKLSHFEVFIDGVKTPLPFPAVQEAGPILLHLPASVLTKGARRIEVAAIDAAGRQARPEPVAVEIRGQGGPALALPYPRAVRLCSTLGHGLDAGSITRILLDGEKAWLAGQIGGQWGGPHDRLVEALANVWFADSSDYHVRGRVITQLLATRHPVREKFALFAQNHFSTWMAKTGAIAKWEEHEAFRNAGIARFRDLLLTSATSPAMMVYLDQQSSLGRQLNENYARELMELHTVGVGAGYQQADVTRLAHLLTGWGAQREATMDGGRIDYNYRFSPYLNESEPLEVFGLSIPAPESPEAADDRIGMVIEMLASRPQTARFISGKIVAHYLGMPVDPPTVDMLAAEFLRSGGDMRRVMTLLAESPRFMAADAAGRLMTPVEFGVAHQRAASAMHPWPVIGLGDRSGRNLFDRASPDGFPESNEEYADSNFQLQKWSYCKEIESALAEALPWNGFAADVLKNPDHRDALIDHAFAARKGSAPSAGSRDALHAILQQEIADHGQRRSLFASFLHMMPEFQTR